MNNDDDDDIDFKNVPFLFVLIGNIPLEFHTPDLRNFFSYAIEKEFFVCFNYRKRPHVSGKFNLGICKVRSARFDEFVHLYHRKNWIDLRGHLKAQKCSVIKIKSSTSITDAATAAALGEKDLNELLEFKNIPSWMERGNVGTPTKIFLNYINECKFPQSLIGKIGIDLSSFRKHKKRIYSNVKYDYLAETSRSGLNDDDRPGTSASKHHYQHHSTCDVARTANGFSINQEINDETKIREINYLKDLAESEKKQQQEKETNPEKLDDDDDDDGDDLEEWERHEALHDDVTKQDRTSPYFFEEEIELKWEKGGSGLVFYTDDNFWKEHENKDFDAETADDLDVDMSIYYEANAGDKDARDLLDMRREEMTRDGKSRELIYDEKREKQLNAFHQHDKDDKANKMGAFEKYTKGFGRRVLEKQGWKEGNPVGLRSGLIEALDASDGKTNPTDRAGIGFRGEKINRHQIIENQRLRRLRENRNSPYYIASKFDKLDPSRPETLLRRFDPTMKYRKQDDDDEKKDKDNDDDDDSNRKKE